jgi:hypothetical protein
MPRLQPWPSLPQRAIGCNRWLGSRPKVRALALRAIAERVERRDGR